MKNLKFLIIKHQGEVQNCKGMVLAIEPMINMGTWQVNILEDIGHRNKDGLHLHIMRIQSL